MFTPSAEANRVLTKFGASYRTHMQDKKYFAQAVDLTTGQLYTVPNAAKRPDDPKKHYSPRIPLEVEGDSPEQAVENLCRMIPAAEKPMTAAQSAGIAEVTGKVAAEFNDKLSEKDREIIELRRRVEEQQRTIDDLAAGTDESDSDSPQDVPPNPDAAPAKRRGRPPKTKNADAPSELEALTS